jgi:hypothetical protein
MLVHAETERFNHGDLLLHVFTRKVEIKEFSPPRHQDTKKNKGSLDCWPCSASWRAFNASTKGAKISPGAPVRVIIWASPASGVFVPFVVVFSG